MFCIRLDDCPSRAAFTRITHSRVHGESGLLEDGKDQSWSDYPPKAALGPSPRRISDARFLAKWLSGQCNDSRWYFRNACTSMTPP